jgi:hypothetical protein
MAWYYNINFFFHCHGLQQSDVDHNLYCNISCDELYIILNLYVDDVLFIRNGIFKMIDFLKKLERNYEISCLGTIGLYNEVYFLYLLEGTMLV